MVDTCPCSRSSEDHLTPTLDPGPLLGLGLRSNRRVCFSMLTKEAERIVSVSSQVNSSCEVEPRLEYRLPGEWKLAECSGFEAKCTVVVWFAVSPGVSCRCDRTTIVVGTMAYGARRCQNDEKQLRHEEARTVSGVVMFSIT